MTRAFRAFPFGLAALMLVVFGSVATAGPKQKIAVLGLEAVVGANGQIDPADTAFAKELTKALRDKANNSKNYDLTKDQRELVDEKLMNNCGAEHPQCMAPIGANMGANVLLFGRVANAKGGGYKVSLTLVDVSKKQVIASDPNATITAAETKQPGLGNWVREHYKKLTGEGGDGTLIITATGANSGRVLINGETRETLKSGQATVSLAPGRYRVGVEADGFKLWEQDAVTVSDDKPTELKPDLVKSKGIDTTVDPNKGNETTTTGTETVITREGTVSGKKSKTMWKVAAAVGLGGAAVGGVWLGYSYMKIRDFENASTTGTMVTGTSVENVVSDADCDRTLNFTNDPNGLKGKLDSACSAKSRMNWLVPTTVGLAAIGAGALIYVLVSKDDAEERPAGSAGRRVKKRNIVVTPIVTQDGTGATLRFDW